MMKVKVKLCLFCLGIITGIIQSCNSAASGCGGGPYYEYKPAITFLSFSIKDSIYTDFNLEVLSPYYGYQEKELKSIPFRIKTNEMTFKVSINGIDKDTITIYYEPKLIYIPETLCEPDEFDVNYEVTNVIFKNKVITNLAYRINERKN